jgi:tetratricopeptide (TPR) repeat protein
MLTLIETQFDQAQILMQQRTPNPNSSAKIMLVLVALMTGGALLVITMQWSHAPGAVAPVAVAPATPDMPVPEVEMVTPTEAGKLETDNAEKAMLKKLESSPLDSPERFEPYGIFALQAEGAGMYEEAEDYYKKAVVLGPVAYKSYFAKPAADFQINYAYMLVNTGRLAEAADVAKVVYDQEVKILGAESQQAIDAGTTLASTLGDAKRYKEKQLLSEKLIALLEKMGKTKEGEYVTALRCLGESYQGQNDMPQAKRWYFKSLAAAKANPELHSYIDNLDQTVASFESIKAAPDSK